MAVALKCLLYNYVYCHVFKDYFRFICFTFCLIVHRLCKSNRKCCWTGPEQGKWVSSLAVSLNPYRLLLRGSSNCCPIGHSFFKHTCPYTNASCLSSHSFSHPFEAFKVTLYPTLHVFIFNRNLPWSCITAHIHNFITALVSGSQFSLQEAKSLISQFQLFCLTFCNLEFAQHWTSRLSLRPSGRSLPPTGLYLINFMFLHQVIGCPVRDTGQISPPTLIKH